MKAVCRLWDWWAELEEGHMGSGMNTHARSMLRGQKQGTVANGCEEKIENSRIAALLQFMLASRWWYPRLRWGTLEKATLEGSV